MNLVLVLDTTNYSLKKKTIHSHATITFLQVLYSLFDFYPRAMHSTTICETQA